MVLALAQPGPSAKVHILALPARSKGDPEGQQRVDLTPSASHLMTGDRGLQIVDGMEGSGSDLAACDAREEALDGVEPQAEVGVK
jgi:hypothetical protein